MMRLILTLAAFVCLGFASRGQVNLNSGLVAHYPFNGNANDISGNNNNPVVVNATLSQGALNVPNTAYLFNGTSNFIEVPHSASLAPAGTMTMYAYVRADGFYYGPCHGNVVMHKGIGDFQVGNYGIRFDDNLYTSGQNCANTAVDTIHQLFYGVRHPSSSPIAPYTPYIQKGQWYCVIAVQDSLNLKLYVNGILVGTKSNPISALGVNTAHLMFGRLSYSTQYPYWFKGAIDEVRIYNRAINAQEIAALCSAPPVVTLPDTTINHYAAVQAYDSCTNSLTLDDALPFNAGDTVLMIQMKGAVVDSSNTASFGNIQQVGNAGNYEFNVIQSKTGNTVALKNVLQRTYTIPTGKVQLVRVPHFSSYTISQTHTAPAWNGAKGGVVVMSVANGLTLNANVDVTGKGFPGGVQTAVSTNVQNCGITTFSGLPTVNNTAEKGQGIAEVSYAKMGGRGKLANGGGAGNGHNAGGGGGGNGGAGGTGGSEYYGCNSSSTPSVTQGLGGLPLNYSTAANKIFLGGGGGAAQANNFTVSSGGTGGGIVIIRAGSITTGNGAQILAKGSAAPICTVSSSNDCHDGMGGGGGGGVVLLATPTITGSLPVDAGGGAGANVTSVASLQQVGPGGGGGGGAVWTSNAAIPATVVVQTMGGANGVILYNSSAWGAQSGSAGQSLTNLSMPVTNVPFVQPPPVSINYSILSCRTVSFTATGGSGTPTWTFGNGGTGTGSPITYTYPAGGTYLVKVQFPGCGGSDTETVVLPNNPTVNAGADVAICAGASTVLTASGAATYSWSPGTGLSATTGATVNASPSTTTSYIVTGTAGTGCTAVDTVKVTVNPLPTVTGTAAPNTICQGASSTLTATSSLTATYAWQPGVLTGSPVTVTPGSSITYTVTATTAAGCTATDTARVNVLPKPVVNITTPDATVCPQTSATLTASAGVTGTYTWVAPASGSTATITTPVLNTPTTFTVYFTASNGCKDTATQAIGIHTPPTVSIAGPASICSGTGPATLTASGAATYVWSPGQYLNVTTGAAVQSLPPTGSSMTYTVTGTDANGCTGTDQHTLAVALTPTVDAGRDTAFCSGNAVTLNASGAASYTWSPTNSTATGSSITVSDPVTTTTVFTYIATGTTGACAGKDTVRITVRALPLVVTAPKVAPICLYDSARLSATGAATYAWTPSSGVASPAAGITMAKPASTTTYTVTGTDVWGCMNTDTARVTVGEALPVKASGDGQPISCANSLAQLHVTGATSYVWSPGRYLNDSTMAHPVATPPQTMQFSVIGSNGAGCTGRDTITVVSLRESTLEMPNAFTPNGDGLNEKLYPQVYCDFNFKSFSVYNRWGQQVFKSSRADQGWDGRFNGQLCDVGVYVFMVEGVGDAGQPKILKGNVTLLR